MQINEIYEIYQWALCAFALTGLALMTLYAFFTSPVGKAAREQLSRLWEAFFMQSAFGKVCVALFFCGMVMYGGSKGFWRLVRDGGGDESLEVCGIYTATSNDVVEVEGEQVTNKLYLVRVEWLGEGGDTNTPVSVRASETNEWTELEKLEPILTLEGGVTNRLDFHTESNMADVAYWWFGVDKPAIVITTDGIEIRYFNVTSKKVYIDFICAEEEATVFYIRRKEVGKSEWETVGTCLGTYGVVTHWEGEMFTVDKTYDWQVITIVEDGGDYYD